MKASITEDKIKGLLNDAAKKLTGHNKRSFIAKVAIELYEGNARQVERKLDWGRDTVEKGIREVSI